MNSDHLAGGSGPYVAVSDEPIDEAALLAIVRNPTAGCAVLFTGTVRNHAPGRSDVSMLEYEAYAEVAELKIREIVGEAMSKWPIIEVAAVHRTGRLGVGESAVVVAVSSAHRRDAFPAARYLIDELKARVPIWKKEHWAGGAEWVEGA